MVSRKPVGPEHLPSAKASTREVLAYWIRLQRVQKGWSQERLAQECELDRTYVSAVERCRWNVSLSNMEKLAAALDMPVWAMLVNPRVPKEFVATALDELRQE